MMKKGIFLVRTQCAATASSSINDVINGSHIATVATAAPEVKQLQCNMASCKKVELLDIETNKTFTLYVNAEDAHKAKNDLNFASALLKYAKENVSNSYAPSTSTTNAVMSSTSDTSDVSDVSDTTRNNNKETYIWNNKETLLLIHLYKENEEIFTSGKIKQHVCWERIAKKMANEGYNISGKNVAQNFKH